MNAWGSNGVLLALVDFLLPLHLFSSFFLREKEKKELLTFIISNEVMAIQLNKREFRLKT